MVAGAYDSRALSAGITGSYAYSDYVPFLGAVNTLTSPAQAFRNAMATYSPKTTIGEYTVGGWTTADLFLKALQVAGKCPTQTGLISAMRAVDAYNPAGMVSQDIRYSPGQTPNGDPLSCVFFIKLNADSFTTPTVPLCGK